MGEEVQATIQQLWSEISKLHGTRTNRIKGKTGQRRGRVLKHELLIVNKTKFIPQLKLPRSVLLAVVRTNSLLCNQGFVSRFVTIYESTVVKEDCYDV